MHRSGSLLVPLFLIAGCGSPSPLPGTVRHGLTGEPLKSFRVLARATSDASMTCQVFEATTDDAGAFTLTGLCDGVSYALSDAEGTLWFEAADVKGGSTTPLALTAWWGPTTSGVFVLGPSGSRPVRTTWTVDKELVGSVEVPFPKELGAAVTLAKGEWLVLTGDAVDGTSFEPVIPSIPKRWWYLGHEFTDAETVVRREVALRADGVKSAQDATHRARYLPATFLPEGRYAVLDADRSHYGLLDVGRSFDDVPAPWPAEPVEGEGAEAEGAQPEPAATPAD